MASGAPADDAPAAAWAAAALDRAHALLARPSVEHQRLVLGPVSVHVHAGSPAMADLALAGLADDVLDGDVLDGDASGAVAGAWRSAWSWAALDGDDLHLDPPPFGPADVLPRDGIRGFEGGRHRAAWAVDRQTLWLLDTEAERGLLWARAPERSAPWDRAAPWRPLVTWAAPAAGTVLAHAAAVAPPGGGAGVLLVGRGGTGKSTLALACAQQGWTVTGDDYVLLEPRAGAGAGGRQWNAVPLYRWAKADDRTLDLVGLAPERCVPEVDHLGKRLLDLRACFGPAGARSLPLAAVVLPQRGRTSSVGDACTPGTALAALGPSTVLQGSGDARPTLALLAQVAADLPARAVHVGPDVGPVGPSLLTEVLAEVPARVA